MIEISLTRRYWFSLDGNLLTTNLSDKLINKGNQKPNELISVSKLADDRVYIVRFKNDNKLKKMWFSDLKDGKLQFMPGSSKKEMKLMQKMYSVILAQEILEK